MKSKTIPIIRKSALLDEWVIITRYTRKDDHILAHIKYPIPKKDIEYIANDWLISQLKDLGYERGFSYKTGSEEEGTLIKVIVERIQKKKDSEETLQTEDEVMKPGFYICGGGSHINCDQWDDVNGCLADHTDAFACRKYMLLDEAHDDDDMDEGAGGY